MLPRKSHREEKSPSFGGPPLSCFRSGAESFRPWAATVPGVDGAWWESLWRAGMERSPLLYVGERSRLITGVKSQFEEDVADDGIDSNGLGCQLQCGVEFRS